MSDQLSLFGDVEPAAGTAVDAALDARRAAAAAIAARLPDTVFFGTSSWTFPGWTHLVYPAGLSTTALGREGLRHYARHPLLRTVGIDRSYYAPIPLDDLRAYADQLPAGFRCCLKAPAAVTSRVEPTFGSNRGPARANPDFLSAGRLIDDLLAPLSAGFAAHTGPIVLEFPPGPRGSAPAAAGFADALDRFLEQLPREFEYAVEIRDRALLTAAYAAVLARHQVAHTYNYWSAMPMPLAQADVVLARCRPVRGGAAAAQAGDVVRGSARAVPPVQPPGRPRRADARRGGAADGDGAPRAAVASTCWSTTRPKARRR